MTTVDTAHTTYVVDKVLILGTLLSLLKNTQPARVQSYLSLRYAASMDVEGKFSELNVRQKRDGRNVGGRSTQQGALQDVKKLLIVAKHENEMILAKSSTTYVQHSFTKSREDLLKWNTPSTSSKRRRAETNNTYEKNNKQLILDPIAVTGTVSSIRSYHKK